MALSLNRALGGLLGRCTQLLWIVIFACAFACGRNDDDHTPPVFDGVQTIEVLTIGSVELTWKAATDPSGVVYDVHHATESGAQSFAVMDALTTVTDATSVVIEDLHAGAGLEHFFVVRARDGAGNIEQNTRELSALFLPNGIELIGQYQMSIAADVAVDEARGIAYVSGWWSEQIHIVDLTQRASPALLTTIDNVGYGGDVQWRGNYLYLSHEFAGRGYDIYDVTDPTQPVLVNQIGPQAGYPPNTEDCHNLWPQPDRDLFYCASTTTGEVVVFSTGEGGVGTEADPVYLTAFRPETGEYGVHDMYAIGNRLYASFLDAGIQIYDITDPAVPLLIGERTYNRMFTHNMWPNEDGTVLFTTDENEGGHLKIWDISDVTDIRLISEYQSNSLATIHNVEVVGDYAYIAYYVEGLKVVDVSDPAKPVEVGSHDFYNGPDTAGFEGAWGVDPHPPYVYVSGMGSGLYVCEFTPPE